MATSTKPTGSCTQNVPCWEQPRPREAARRGEKLQFQRLPCPPAHAPSKCWLRASRCLPALPSLAPCPLLAASPSPHLRWKCYGHLLLSCRLHQSRGQVKWQGRCEGMQQPPSMTTLITEKQKIIRGYETKMGGEALSAKCQVWKLRTKLLFGCPSALQRIVQKKSSSRPRFFLVAVLNFSSLCLLPLARGPWC